MSLWDIKVSFLHYWHFCLKSLKVNENDQDEAFLMNQKFVTLVSFKFVIQPIFLQNTIPKRHFVSDPIHRPSLYNFPLNSHLLPKFDCQKYAITQILSLHHHFEEYPVYMKQVVLSIIYKIQKPLAHYSIEKSNYSPLREIDEG